VSDDRADNEPIESQVDRLANYIIREWPDHPAWAGGGGACDMAIRILTSCKGAHIEHPPLPTSSAKRLHDRAMGIVSEDGADITDAVLSAVAERDELASKVEPGKVFDDPTTLPNISREPQPYWRNKSGAERDEKTRDVINDPTGGC
jgi:hypothetical protein